MNREEFGVVVYDYNYNKQTKKCRCNSNIIPSDYNNILIAVYPFSLRVTNQKKELRSIELLASSTVY